jgi:hypothetical protein
MARVREEEDRVPSNAQEHRAPSNAALPWNTGGSGVVLMKTRLSSSSSSADEDEAVLVIISTSPGPCGLHATREMQGAHDGMRVAWMWVACMRAIGCGMQATRMPHAMRVPARERYTGSTPERHWHLAYTAAVPVRLYGVYVYVYASQCPCQPVKESLSLCLCHGRHATC